MPTMPTTPDMPDTPGHTSTVQWLCLPFDRLTTHQLYAALQLRAEVFVVEQRCAFQDLDGADAACHHLLGLGLGAGLDAPPLLAYARLVPAGLKYPEASIGRVLTSAAARGRALGHQLVAHACQQLHTLWGPQPIRIGAQAHLQAFYGQHGFVSASPPYLEDGIPHMEMLRPAGAITTRLRPAVLA